MTVDDPCVQILGSRREAIPTNRGYGTVLFHSKKVVILLQKAGNPCK